MKRHEVQSYFTPETFIGAFLSRGRQGRAALRAAWSGTLAVAGSLLLASRAVAAVDLAIQVNPDTAAPGTAVMVEITVANIGAIPESSLTVALTYPAALDSLNESLIHGPLDASASCQGGNNSLCQAGESILWNLGTLGPGQSVELSLPPIVANSTVDGTVIDWEATVSNAGGDLATAAAALVVDADPVLTVAIDADRDPVPAGALLRYTLRYGNASGSNVTDASLDFTLPDGAAFVSASGGGLAAGNVVSWDLGTLLAGAIAQQVVEVSAPAAGSGTLLESAARIGGIYNFAATERHAHHSGRVGAGGPLALALAVNPLPAKSGDTVLVQMVVSNPTAAPVPSARLTLRYPGGVNDLNESYISGPLTTSVSCQEGNVAVCQAREVVIWDVGPIFPGQAQALSLPPIVGNVAAGTLIGWRVELVDDSGALSFESATLAVESDPALTVAIDADRDPVPAGAVVRYTLRYGNAAGSNVTNTVLDFTLPEGASFISATGGGLADGGVVSWGLGTILAGAVAQQVVEVNAATTSDGTLLESAARIGGTYNFVSTERRARHSGRIGAGGPLALGLTVNPLPAASGDTAQVQMVVSNPTAAPVPSARLTVRYPGGVNDLNESYISGPLTTSASCQQGNAAICQAREFVIWDVGPMFPGQAQVLSLPPIVDSVAAGTLIGWRVELVDDSGALSVESATLPVESDPALTVAIDANRDPVPAGELLRYTVRYGNAGGSNVTAATIDLALPDGATFISATGGGLSAGGVVSWDLGTMLAGAVGQRVVEVSAPGASDGTLLESAARIGGTYNFVATERRARHGDRIGAGGPLALGLTVNPLPAASGDTVQVQMVVSNPTAAPVPSARLTLRYPGGMNDLNESLIPGPLNTSASCQQGNVAICQAREFVIWDFAVNPGEVIAMDLPPVVANATLDGTLIRWEGLLSDDSGAITIASATLPVGSDPLGDPEGDGIGNSFDNCLLVINSDQRDTDGDGYGNVCDADFSQPNDCNVNFLDLGVMKVSFFVDPSSPEGNPDTDMDGDGQVNFVDLGIMKGYFLGRPGPSAASASCD